VIVAMLMIRILCCSRIVRRSLTRASACGCDCG
jgi:hypothetical protein